MQPLTIEFLTELAERGITDIYLNDEAFSILANIGKTNYDYQARTEHLPLILGCLAGVTIHRHPSPLRLVK